MKVRFLARQQPRTGRPEGDPVFEEGETYDLREDQARKWVNRNVAVFVKDGEKPKPAPSKREPDPEPEPIAASAPDAMTTADLSPTPKADEYASAAYEDMTRDELLDLAGQRGVELPAGYVRKEQLIEALQDAGR